MNIRGIATGVLTVGVALGLTACGDKNASETEASEIEQTPVSYDARLDSILASDHRTDQERARDAARNPTETLLFFDVQPSMTIVEVWPGGGWYTQIIAPYLKTGDGKLLGAMFSTAGASERALSANAAYEQAYTQNPEIYGNVEMIGFKPGEDLSVNGRADIVLTFRNIHNWGDNKQAAFNSFYKALRPGGILGVVEHRADGAELPRDGSSGYIYTDDVIAMAQTAGFDLEATSEINANPADTKDHPFGVWTLPPTSRSAEIGGQEDPAFDGAAFKAIGESDRMTLKFRKPIAADGALLE